MRSVHCDSCTGPHCPTSPLCAGNCATPSYLLAAGAPLDGGLYLYHLHQHTRLPGVYELLDLEVQGSRGVGWLQRTDYHGDDRVD